MKARPAAGGTLADRMDQQFEIADWPALVAHLQDRYDFWNPTEDNITVEKYGVGIDERIGWDTHLVCVDGKACLFTDGPMSKP